MFSERIFFVFAQCFKFSLGQTDDRTSVENTDREYAGILSLQNVCDGISGFDHFRYGIDLKCFHIFKDHIRIRSSFLIAGVRAEPAVRCITGFGSLGSDNLHHNVCISGSGSDFDAKSTELFDGLNYIWFRIGVSCEDM